MNIGQQRDRQINTLCLLLGHSRQAYYQQKRAIEKEAIQYELVIQQVLLFRERQKKIGARKLFAMLAPFLEQHCIPMGRDTLFRLLAENNLLIRKRCRKIPRTTFSDHWMRKHPNLIEGMEVIRPNYLWVSDITYVVCKDGFGYLSLITDAYSRKIVGYHLHRDLTTEGCLKALKMALKQLPSGSMLTHHSDRGCQYCSTEYVELLTENRIAISMTQNSDPRENAIAERVNGILKLEFLATEDCSFMEAVNQVKQAVFIYNNERLHSSIEMKTPNHAHYMNRPLKRHWKSYYTSTKKEVTMT
jgi:transposase InsO family protein